MKLFLALSLVILSGVSARAAQVCSDVKETLSYASIQPNFDGSVVVTTPRLLGNGQMLPVIYYALGNGDTAICAQLSKKVVNSSIAALQNSTLVIFVSGGNQVDVRLSAIGESIYTQVV